MGVCECMDRVDVFKNVVEKAITLVLDELDEFEIDADNISFKIELRDEENGESVTASA